MSPDDTDVWAKFISGGRRDLYPLLKRYKSWLKMLKGSYAGRFKDLLYDDVANEVELGFAQAASRYDPTAGAKFETYATPRILGSVQDYARQVDPLSRNERAEFGSDFSVASINAAADDTQSLLETMEARLNEEALASDMALELWAKITYALHKHKKQLLALWCCYREHWMGIEVAHYMGVSESRVSQMCSEAIELLRANKEIIRYMAGRRKKRRKDFKGGLRYETRKRKGGRSGRCEIPRKGYHCHKVGCPYKIFMRGCCSKHYYQQAQGNKQCLVPWCTGIAEMFGMCRMHYNYKLKYGTALCSPLKAGKLRWRGMICKECNDRPVASVGLCKRCYTRQNQRRRRDRVRAATPRLCKGGCGVTVSNHNRLGWCRKCSYSNRIKTWKKSPKGRLYAARAYLRKLVDPTADVYKRAEQRIRDCEAALLISQAASPATALPETPAASASSDLPGP